MRNANERMMLAAAGVGIGWMIVLACGWPLWSALVVCTVAAGICFRPGQIVSDIRDQFMQWLTKEAVIQSCRNAAWGVAMFFYLLLGAITVMLVPVLIFAAMKVYDGEAYVILGFLAGLIPMFFGGVYGEYVREMQGKAARVREGQEEKWGMPILRRMPASLLPPEDWFYERTSWESSAVSRLHTATWKIPVAQCLGIYFIALGIIDVLLTIGIIVATSERTSVAAGGFCGGLVGYLLAISGWANPAVFVFAGMAAGGFVGRYWYPVAKYLESPAWGYSKKLAANS